MKKETSKKFNNNVKKYSQNEHNYELYTKLSHEELVRNTIKKVSKEEGALEKEKEVAVNFYKNGASKELIIKSLNITEEKLDEYLKDGK